jgi:hypothetical protein
MRAFFFRGGRRKIAFEVGIPFPVHIVERSAIGGLYPLLLLDTHRNGLFYIPSVWLGVIVDNKSIKLFRQRGKNLMDNVILLEGKVQ